MENENIKGHHWIGVFTSDNGIAEIDFTEVVMISKKVLLKPFEVQQLTVTGIYNKHQ
ncbi:hypothetical protein [Proteus genomosp. 4]|uniref:hypothetical protein n=1 Tax=Proteus genomosp. 4 TaxID=1311818 RepID=UPI0013A54DEF|nr:hypothetical protein [Proteus genomosp. 4]